MRYLAGHALSFAVSCGLLFGFARAAEQAAPDDLSKWDLICYCNAVFATPHAPVRADDNGRILYHARNGITKAQLEALGVPVTDSQLLLLRSWRLLKKKGDIFSTDIPLLGPDRITRLRERLRAEGARAEPDIRGDIVALTNALKAQGHKENGYSVVFSYVLDGLLWDRLDKDLPKTDIDAEHPFWGGTFWAVYPKRDNAPGTNTQSADRVTMGLTWTDSVVAPLNALQSAPATITFLKSIAAGKPDAAPVSVEGQSWQFMRADGTFLVPVIHRRQGDPIYDAASHAADALAARLTDARLRAEIKGDVPNATDPEIILIATHEFIWELLDRLVGDGLVAKPAVLSGGTQTSESLRSLVYLVVKD